MATTYRELAYFCLDNAKLSSDDSYYTVDHVVFLINKIRAVLLDQRYANGKREIPDSNYQTLCLDLQETNKIENTPCLGTILKSVQKIPDALLGNPLIYPQSYFTNSEITFVNKERFRFVGHNKWLQNIIYATEFNNNLYLTSANPQYKYLKKVQLKGIFEDPTKAFELECNKDNKTNCDVLEQEVPLEETLMSPLIELVGKVLKSNLYLAKDDINNASDDQSQLATFIARNAKSALQKQIDGQ